MLDQTHPEAPDQSCHHGGSALRRGCVQAAPGTGAIVGLFQTPCLGSVTERISSRFHGNASSRSLTFPLVLDDFEGQEERRGTSRATFSEGASLKLILTLTTHRLTLICARHGVLASLRLDKRA